MLTHVTDKKSRLSSKSGHHSPRSPWRAQHAQVKQILRHPVAQQKLTIGAPNDKYEQEADRVADQVMRMPAPHATIPDGELTVSNTRPINGGTIQRLCTTCSNEYQSADRDKRPVEPLDLCPKCTGARNGLVQTKRLTSAVQQQADSRQDTLRVKSAAGGELDAAPEVSAPIRSLQGGGQPLSSSERSFFEPRFGVDFSGVRVHNDRRAAGVARSVNARAFTLGHHVVFGSGEYNSGGRSGRKLLAHELTHVVQQRGAGAADVSTRSRSVLQRRIGDGHDLQSPRFAGDTRLEDIYDGTGTLKDGDESESVRKVQHAIHDFGIRFSVIGVDGRFGDQTQRRVRRFQNRNRITTDPGGEVGDATIEKLDQLFPAMALPSAASGAYNFPCMLQLLCQWNSAMIRDLRNMRVIMVADLEWADERFNGTSWQSHPMDGAGETSGHTIRIATDDTCENVARTFYHEYQHARSPLVHRSGDWGDEESYAFRLETDWAVARDVTPDPSVTMTDPVTGQTVTDVSGIANVVESYPGLDTANPGEVIGKVGANRVRVRLPDNREIVRDAVGNARGGDTVPGRRVTQAPRRRVRDREWRC